MSDNVIVDWLELSKKGLSAHQLQLINAWHNLITVKGKIVGLQQPQKVS